MNIRTSLHHCKARQPPQSPCFVSSLDKLRLHANLSRVRARTDRCGQQQEHRRRQLRIADCGLRIAGWPRKGASAFAEPSAFAVPTADTSADGRGSNGESSLCAAIRQHRAYPGRFLSRHFAGKSKVKGMVVRGITVFRIIPLTIIPLTFLRPVPVGLRHVRFGCSWRRWAFCSAIRNPQSAIRNAFTPTLRKISVSYDPGTKIRFDCAFTGPLLGLFVKIIATAFP